MKASRPTRIGIVVKLEDAQAAKRAASLFKQLHKMRPRPTLYVEDAIRSFSPAAKLKDAQFSNLPLMTRHCDLLLSIGGDGTILRCTRFLLAGDAWKHCRIMGIKAGKVGFLTSLAFEDSLKRLPGLLKNARKTLIEETRMCLEVKVFRGGKLFKNYHVLNDCVLSKGSLSRIFEYHVDIDGEFLSSYRADGLVISPPTGSTAYNLAAGGSIIEPGIPAIQLTPISPQYFSNKPILVSDRRKIRLRLGRHSTDVYLTMDGHTGLRIQDDDEIFIGKSKKGIRFVLLASEFKTHYFHSLRQKLNWGLVQRRGA